MAAASFAYRAKHNSDSSSDSDNSDQECSDWKRATRKQKNSLEQIPIDPPPTEPSENNTSEDKSITTRPPTDPPTTKRKRNNIWCEVLEDQILSESLNHCGVKQKPKGYGSRGEESYDYTLGRKFYKRDDCSDGDMSDGGMSDSTETSSVTSSVRDKRFNQRKYVKLDGAGTEAARKIVKILGEQKPYLIFRVVKEVGIEKAMELLRKTEEVEEKGGMMIKNNSRRRTPGGVYFQLLKSDPAVSKSVVDKVFEGEMNSFEAKRLNEERKKRKKHFAELKKAAKKAAFKATELPPPSKFPQPVIKQEENTITMDEDSMLVEEELPNEQSSTNHSQEAKDLDLEDGEIDD
ncbi:hypothetical protein JTE90_025077 [Oedothorax gibbosus]|uniref:Phosphorylated adapter RNA export protein n=1 Tax=Oedothorax gibbosus TaxID=931172 RepID=A0AAV6U6G4_9ARAC|nr:hypothetical protein JTE90_025077 [Oedothorax gibbosus]